MWNEERRSPLIFIEYILNFENGLNTYEHFKSNTNGIYNTAISSFDELRVGENEIQQCLAATIATYCRIYFAFMSQLGYAHKTVYCHISAISFKNKINNLVDFSKLFLVRKMLDGMKKIDMKKDIRRPITTAILARIINRTKQ